MSDCLVILDGEFSYCVTNPLSFLLLISFSIRQFCLFPDNAVIDVVRTLLNLIHYSAQTSVDESLYLFQCSFVHSTCFELCDKTDLTFVSQYHYTSQDLSYIFSPHLIYFALVLC